MSKKENGHNQGWILLVEARKLLDEHWKGSFKNGFHGRTWGSKINKENPYYGSNIIFCKEKEIVVVNQDKEGKLNVHGFSKNDDTSLAQEVKSLLKKEDLMK